MSCNNKTTVHGTDEAIAKLFEAVAGAQAEIGGGVKSSENPFFKSQYADLHACREAVREVFGRHGISIVQIPEGSMDSVAVASVRTLLTHKDGAYIEGVASCKAADGSPQKMGSAITYLRRYSLAAYAGLAQTDDDGNSNQVIEPVKCDKEAVYAFADGHEAFAAEGMFDDWVMRVKGKNVSDLTKGEADKLIAFLGKDRSTWPQIMVDKLEESAAEMSKAI